MLKLKVPATSANLGPGFDTLGLAMKVYNTFFFSEIDRGIDLIIRDKSTGKIFEIPQEDNLLYQAMKFLFNKRGKEFTGLKIIEEINIPFARGMGSSATAVTAGLVAANILMDKPYTEQEIIDFSVEIEGHPDNVLPALKGGFVINVMGDNGLVYKKMTVSNNLKIVMIIPDFQLKTEDLRSVLPDKIQYRDAIFNQSRTALLTACFYDNDWSKLRSAMEDRLHQDYRADLIPGFHKLLEIAYQSGALGVALSGAGPSLLAFCKQDEELIGQNMAAEFAEFKINSTYMITEVDNKGIQVEKTGVR
ncbi:MAG: homoserine kinase [Firmicutes bacterium]|nr:homoserine kinase [Bacillota bacterium]